jgi:hypothetical protein
MRRSFPPAVLARLRNLPLEEILPALAIYCKADPTYAPLKDPHSHRWHVRSACGEYEILTTGPKWYDTRQKKGGGGAIDLAMHLLQVPFVEAVKQLIERHSRNS